MQAVGGAVLAAIGLWYDDYTAGSANPVTEDLVKVLSFNTGVNKNDRAFRTVFPYVAMPNIGTGECGGVAVEQVVVDSNSADLELMVSVPSETFEIYKAIPYTIKVTNNGPATATNITVQAGIPEGEAYGGNENPSKGSYNLFFETWTIPVLDAGETATLELRVFPKSGNTSLSNFFQIKTSSKTDPDSTPGNDVNQTPDEDDEVLIQLTQVSNFTQNLEKSKLEATEAFNIKSIFPNPASELLNIDFTIEEDRNINLLIYDLHGRIVQEKSVSVRAGFNSVKLKVAALSSGIYFLSIPELTAKDKRIKFVKE